MRLRVIRASLMAMLVSVGAAHLWAMAVPAVQAAPPAAPAFRLPLLSGGTAAVSPGATVSLAEFKGRPLILLFWAPW